MQATQLNIFKWRPGSTARGRARQRTGFAALIGAVATLLPLAAAQAGPSVIVDVASGKVLEQDQPTRRWYPASLTKLMTVYVTLAAVRDGRVTLDTPFIMSPRAAREAPSKMGFASGTAVTLDNALKMLMVKSANDIAVMIAEGIAGSVDDFAEMMNATASKLGLHESHFATPNGLPDPENYSSARDMAMIAMALYRDFPDEAGLFGIGALRLDGKIIPTHNGLLGRFPGADGMKTGFICASGFNVVASATRGGRHLIAVVMGSPSAKARTTKVATMLDAAFAGGYPPSGTLTDLAGTGDTTPVDIRQQVCGRHRLVQEDDFPVPIAGTSTQGSGDLENPRDFVLQQASGAHFQPSMPGSKIVLSGRPYFEPIDVFTGPKPGWTGAVAKARDMPGPSDATAYAPHAPSAETAATPLKVDPAAVSMKLSGKTRHGKVGTAAAKAIAAKSETAKSEAAKSDESEPDTKAKPAHAVHKQVASKKTDDEDDAAAKASVKPAAKVTAKPSVKAAKTAAKPEARAKVAAHDVPKPAAKPAAKAGVKQKPAAKANADTDASE